MWETVRDVKILTYMYVIHTYILYIYAGIDIKTHYKQQQDHKMWPLERENKSQHEFMQFRNKNGEYACEWS